MPAAKKPPTTIEGTLRAMRRLLDDPKRWTKHTAARDAARKQVSALSDSACSFCLLGASSRATQGLYELDNKVRGAMHSSLDGSVVTFNDSRSTTHADVLAFLDMNIKLARWAGV